MTHLSATEIAILVSLVLATFSACMLPRVFHGVGKTIRKLAAVNIDRDDFRTRA